MMSLYSKIVNKEEKLAVIGLGYVGIPLAIAFAKKASVIGYDINSNKINNYKLGIDDTNETNPQDLNNTTVYFTSNEEDLSNAKFFIVAVPTPINGDKTPDLNILINATKTVGKHLSNNAIVVFESTVFPGVTEDICIPILEKESGLICGKDFKVGYSPERINPGDKIHTLETITKIVSGMDSESLEIISRIYELVITAGVYQSESIKVAEAAKIIENSQRDINIAFMNELSKIFNNMQIDTQAVLKAANTKWNFLNFTPGLVGGHCIGVDPYYFTYKAEQLGYHSQIILAGRKINDSMGKYIAENTIKQLIKADKRVKGARIAIMGITFKENCPDIRNTKVIDVINTLKEYELEIIVCDPIANKDEVLSAYKIELEDFEHIKDLDAIIFAVSHSVFKKISLNTIKKMYKDNPPIVIDIKGLFDRTELEHQNIIYWNL